MAQQFKEQGGAATMDPSNAMRWATSRVVRTLTNSNRLAKARRKTERQRVAKGQPHRIEYFHQLDDGYSHLAAQALAPLLERYDVELVCHVVRGPEGSNLPEPKLLPQLSVNDAGQVAPHYGLEYPAPAMLPGPQAVADASQILTAVDPGDFPQVATAVGRALLGGTTTDLPTLANRYGQASSAEAAAAVEAGTSRRKTLGHYSGAMFYYGGEWYWGVDRLYHLEQRLLELGASRAPDQPLLFPRPAIEVGPLKGDGSLTLEVYASLRSPYTAMIFDQAVSLARETGVTLDLKPVLPMVMRGVSATREKGFYIFGDACREARALGVDFGKFYDPIGEPARRCYSLFSWAREQGKEVDLMASFLRAAFVEGVNTNRNSGQKHVVEQAGLSWSEALKVIDNTDWADELERNRLSMYGFGSWGVPSFRLLDATGGSQIAVWGQDRLWLVSREIQRLLGGAG